MFGIFFTVLFTKLIRNMRVMTNPAMRGLNIAVIVALLSYGIAGMSGRDLFPNIANSYFYIILAFAVVIERISKYTGGYVYGKP